MIDVVIHKEIICYHKRRQHKIKICPVCAQEFLEGKSSQILCGAECQVIYKRVYDFIRRRNVQNQKL